MTSWAEIPGLRRDDDELQRLRQRDTAESTLIRCHFPYPRWYMGRMPGDIRDFGIAVSAALRLNDCYHQMSEAFTARPAVAGDDDLLFKRLQVYPPSPETDEWVHRSNCAEIAQRYIRAGILNRDFPLWIRIKTGEVQADPYAIVTVTNRTIATGLYLSDNRPMNNLEGRPLWVKLTDWKPFLSRSIADRYGVPAATRAPAYKSGRPPPDDEIVAKAREMHTRGLTTYKIASRMRLEAGFENVGTRHARDLIRGLFKSTGRPKER